MFELTDRYILKYCKFVVFNAIKFINDRVEEKFGLEVEQPSFKDPTNITRALDIWAHKYYKTAFDDKFGNEVAIIGEEAKKPKELKANFVASIDAIDGTDLMVRSLSNWCSALFVFRPNDRVIVSLVGMHNRVVYYASEAGAKKLWIPKGESSKKVKTLLIPKNGVKKLQDASICFYGQKANNFLSILSKKPFLKQLKKISTSKKPMPLRIYNLGGNPMMIRLAEGKVDAVIELKGQKLYDVIPGAFIATKAGAFWGDLNGKCIDNTYLKKILANPDGRLSYILASTEELYKRLLSFFR